MQHFRVFSSLDKNISRSWTWWWRYLHFVSVMTRWNLICFQRALDAFGGINNGPPVRIVFFRDGLSEGEFEGVGTIEIEAIQCLFLKSKSIQFHLTFFFSCYWWNMESPRADSGQTQDNLHHCWEKASRALLPFGCSVKSPCNSYDI